MTRVKSSVTHKKRVKKILHLARGYYGKRKNVYSLAKQSVMRAGAYAFAHRRKKKGDFRRLWHVRINAALDALPRELSGGLSYAPFVYKLEQANISLNRKALAYLAVHDVAGFTQLVREVAVPERPQQQV